MWPGAHNTAASPHPACTADSGRLLQPWRSTASEIAWASGALAQELGVAERNICQTNQPALLQAYSLDTWPILTSRLPASVEGNEPRMRAMLHQALLIMHAGHPSVLSSCFPAWRSAARRLPWLTCAEGAHSKKTSVLLCKRW